MAAHRARSFAGGFYLQLGNPEASKEARKADAILTVKATGCHDPARATHRHRHRSGEWRAPKIPLKVHRFPSRDVRRLQQWPKEGKWVIQVVGRNDEQFTNTLVSAGPNGVDRARLKPTCTRSPPSDIDAMLK